MREIVQGDPGDAGTEGQILFVGEDGTLAQSDDIYWDEPLGAITAGAPAASAVTFTPGGTISATDVQAAIEEIAAEGAGDPTMGGDLSGTATNAQIVAGAVGTPELAAGAVTAAKVAADVATQAELDAHTTATTAAHGGIVASSDSRLTDARAPTGSAGGALTGTYPNPSFAAGAAVADATGGLVIDVNTRAQLNALLARLRTLGLIAP